MNLRLAINPNTAIAIVLVAIVWRVDLWAYTYTEIAAPPTLGECIRLAVPVSGGEQ